MLKQIKFTEQLYQHQCINAPFIEQHASSKVYPEKSYHPHDKYSKFRNLEILNMSPILAKIKNEKIKLYEDRTGKKYDPSKQHWLDFIKIQDLQCFPCINKVAFEKIMALDDADNFDSAIVYNDCPHSLFAAAKRQMKAALKPEQGVAEDFINFSKQLIDKYLDKYLKHFSYSYQQWYEHNNLAKQRAIDDYMDYQLGNKIFNKQEIKQFETTEYEGICKKEIQEEDGKPRMVCSIPIKTKVTMGPVTWKLEEIMEQHFPGYCGSKNQQQLSKQINKIYEDGFTKVVEGDGSAFDNTQDVSLKEIDRYIYSRIADKIYHVPKKQFIEISQQLYKTMTAYYIDKHSKKKKMLIKYRILGSVFSGDCDTTLCNTLRMVLYNRYVNEKAGLIYGKDFKVISKGDDFTIFYKPYITNQMIQDIYYKYEAPTADLDQLGKNIYGLGQVLKKLDIGGITNLTFCSLRAWQINELSIILTRNPKKFTNLSLFSRKIKKFSGLDRVSFLHQQAVALRKAYPGIIIFEVIADAYDYYALLTAKQTYTKIDLDTKIAIAMKAQQMYTKESRRILPRDHPLSDNTLRMQGEVIHRRKKNVKISMDGYWETMQRLAMKTNYNLTPQQIDLVNQQMQAEFSVEYFKALLGLNLSLLCQKEKQLLKILIKN